MENNLLKKIEVGDTFITNNGNILVYIKSCEFGDVFVTQNLEMLIYNKDGICQHHVCGDGLENIQAVNPFCDNVFGTEDWNIKDRYNKDDEPLYHDLHSWFDYIRNINDTDDFGFSFAAEVNSAALWVIFNHTHNIADWTQETIHTHYDDIRKETRELLTDYGTMRAYFPKLVKKENDIKKFNLWDKYGL